MDKLLTTEEFLRVDRGICAMRIGPGGPGNGERGYAWFRVRDVSAIELKVADRRGDGTVRHVVTFKCLIRGVDEYWWSETVNNRREADAILTFAEEAVEKLLVAMTEEQ